MILHPALLRTLCGFPQGLDCSNYGDRYLSPLAEYMQTSYRPDREYTDGELRDRNLGKFDQGRVQWLISQWIQPA